jgi:transcriptional regulator with GAF, ATPase, and Fis domain
LRKSRRNKLVKKLGKKIEKIPQKTMQALQHYDWPGNVRELENVIERAVINAKDSTLYLADKLDGGEVEESAAKTVTSLSVVERDHIIQMLKETKWQVSGKKGAAALLGLNPSTLRGRMRKFGIRKPWEQSS